MTVPSTGDSNDEMDEFLVYDNAFRNGFSPTSLLRRQQAQRRSHQDTRINEMSSQFTSRMEQEDNKWNELLARARALTPQEQSEYCMQLNQRVEELNRAVEKQREDYRKAGEEVAVQKKENAALVSAVASLRHGLKSSQGAKNSPLVSAGIEFCGALSQTQERHKGK